ncbi:MAG: excinuclease ABC subunit UvrA [Chlorobi bacterium]|nr:excinuclease ABC subunit UvrA [Chlorobiota bacterium]
MPEKITENTHIIIKGARVHNLKNIDLQIPRNKFIVITGLSGSGKSSLAFDTLYAEGQRRYVESLSAYARQFLGKIQKPEVDYIKGIPPAIAIEQKVNTRNPRSTVGTSTEIYDYLKLLFARIGKTYSPVSGKIVKKHTISDVVNFIYKLEPNSKIIILAPIIVKTKAIDIYKQLETLLQQGFTRIEINDEIKQIEILLNEKLLNKPKKMNLVIDRFVLSNDDNMKSRIYDSVETTFYEGHGKCLIKYFVNNKVNITKFSNIFEADGIKFEIPSPHMFSFNNPMGACKKCEGFGQIIGIDKDLVIPNKSLSIYQDAIACWKGEKLSTWKKLLIKNADQFNFPIHKPYFQLSDKQKELLWTGNQYFNGLNDFFRDVEQNTYKIQYRVLLSRYRGKTICPDCKGTRLKKAAQYVKVNGKTISELVLLPVDKLLLFFKNLKLSDNDKVIADRILIEINSRLQFLLDVGLSYLNLNRLSSSLSGGESQRINLATSLGSSLIGSMYILDEPSIGLHPRDTMQLIGVLKKLRSLGNTVIVVEHDEEIISEADEIIDIGPLAGSKGGEIIYQGKLNLLNEKTKSLTVQYMSGKKRIEIPPYRRNWNNYIKIIGARENNLKNITVKIPLNVLTVLSGVSGSGKSSLLNKTLYPALKKLYGGYGGKTGEYDTIEGDISLINDVEFITQNPIGKSTRSNPVTYIKAYDEIRKLFANQKSAKYQGFKPSHFSFNVDGGRCDECQGEGIIKVEMQFMADVELICESCKGKRFKDDVLEIEYKGKNIFNILELTVNQAIDFFSQSDKSTEKKILKKLQVLQDVGLGYVKLGQPSSTLSGGESQRIKLASFLSIEHTLPTLFIFDEPTIGLHFHDISKLLESFQKLIKKGHSIVIIEHNIEIIKCADWIIDLGKEGGEKGGNIIFEGIPEEIIKVKNSYTGQYLKEKL